MMFDFGFDLAARKAPGLRRGLIHGVLAALAETLCYAQLYQALTRALNGQASAALAAQTLVVLLACNALAVFFKARANIANYSAVYALVADARLNIADGLSRLPMGVFLARRRAAITELLTGRYAHYQEIIARVWGVAVMNCAVPCLLWLMLAWLDLRLALVCAVLGLAAFAAIPWSQRLLSRADQKLATLREAVVVAVVEQAESQRELRQFDRQSLRLRHAQHLLAQLESDQMRAELAPAPALLVFSFALQAGFAGTVLLCAWQWRGVADVVLLVIALRYFRALADLGLNLAELRHAKDTLASIRALAQEAALPEAAQSARPEGHELHIRQLRFRYPGASRDALHDIDAHVRAGEMIALVGPSGSGKSTFASLLARMWDPDEGQILLGGADLREMSAQDRQRTLAMVLQEVVLFPGSIADNIRLGRPQASLADVQQAARRAHAAGFIEALPLAYDTIIHPEATGLSGGECQRLAIARALINDAPVLILDEALANVDPDHSWQIQAALAELCRGRTVFIIAHQLQSIVGADQIWVFKDGSIVERGRHKELLTRQGVYAGLWQAQRDAK